jgi:hypothetical protein
LAAYVQAMDTRLCLPAVDWLLQFVIDEARFQGFAVTVGELRQAVLSRCILFHLDPEDPTRYTAEQFFNMLDGQMSSALIVG